MMIVGLLLLLLLLFVTGSADDDIRTVVCLGDSITYGGGDQFGYASYPTRLQQLLGDSFTVLNLGGSGATAMETEDAFVDRYEDKWAIARDQEARWRCSSTAVSERESASRSQ